MSFVKVFVVNESSQLTEVYCSQEFTDSERLKTSTSQLKAVAVQLFKDAIVEEVA